MEIEDFFNAIDRGDIQTVRDIVRRDRSFVNQASASSGDRYEIPLTLAAHRCHLDIVKFLIENGASIDLVNRDDYTALMEALENDDDCIEIVEYLLSNNADPNVENVYHVSALGIASSKNNFDAVKLLVEAGADINFRNGNTLTSALTYATNNSNTDMAQYLLEKDADIDILNNVNATPLFFASANNDINMVDLLIDHGANINVFDIDGFCPLTGAIYYGNTEIVKKLIDRGADVNSQNEDGMTALMFASSGRHFDIVKLLVESGADLNLTANTGETALSFAYGGGNENTNIIDYLREQMGHVGGYYDKYIKYKKKYFKLKNLM